MIFKKTPRFRFIGKAQVLHTADLIDISTEGLRARYIAPDKWSSPFDHITITNADNSVIADDIYCKIISDFQITYSNDGRTRQGLRGQVYRVDQPAADNVGTLYQGKHCQGRKSRPSGTSSLIEKIISSGYTGPEKAALDAALKYGVPHAGWIHYIRSEERDKLLDTYNLKVIPALDPRAAIRQNITHANGTLILAAGKVNKESDYARYLTLKRGLQLLGIDPQQYSHIEAGSLIAAWVEMNRVSRVYITGSDDAALGCTYHPSRKIIDAAVTLSLAKPAFAPPTAGERR